MDTKCSSEMSSKILCSNNGKSILNFPKGLALSPQYGLVNHTTNMNEKQTIPKSSTNTASKILVLPSKRVTQCRSRLHQTPYGTIGLTWTYCPRYSTWKCEVFTTTKLLRRRSLVKLGPHFRRPLRGLSFVRAIALRVLKEALAQRGLRNVSTKKRVTQNRKLVGDQPPE